MDIFEQLRHDEFSRLDAAGHVYLDYTGAGLYAESQIRAHAEMLLTETLGNPHSQNPTSLASTHHVHQARRRILEHFDADPEEYEAIFTLNASGALKLIGESYPFEPGSAFVLVSDNHNSVNGIREFAREHGTLVRYLPLNAELRVEGIEGRLVGVDAGKPHLFAYPAQSNFTGVKHSLEWIEIAHKLGYDVLLDAAAFVPTNRLSLRQVKPDFVCLSFYKMFGYPTGVGALVARRDALRKLHRPWFAGGTVRFVSAQNKEYLLSATGEAFEDGTLNFQGIAAIPLGLDFIERVGIDAINQHVTRLIGQVLDGLAELRHSNGSPLVDVYGPRSIQHRGCTVSFNVLTPGGHELDSHLIEARANQARISLRTGCFCNPGAAEAAFQYAAVQAYQCYHTLTPESFSLQQFSTCMNDKPVGAVRVSVGIASNDADIQRLFHFLRTFIDFEPGEHAGRSLPEYISD